MAGGVGNPITINASDVNVSGFGVTNCLADSDSAGIRAKPTSGSIERVRVSDVNSFSNTGAGIHITASYSTIEDSFAVDTIWGFRIDFGTNYLVQNCVAHDNNRIDIEPNPDVFGQGIRVISVTDSNIVDSNFFNNARQGILLSKESGDSNNLLLSNVRLYSNGRMSFESSIEVSNTDFVTIKDSNFALSTGSGIYFNVSKNNLLTQNIFSGNQRNIQTLDFNDSRIINNSFGASIYDNAYFDRSYRNVFSSNVVSATASSYFGINLTGSGARGSSDNNILDNNFISGYGGIKLDISANSNLFMGNRLSGMTYGVRIFNGTNNTFRTNHIYSNTYGIRVGSAGNFIYDNNFYSNTNHTYSSSAAATWTLNRVAGTNILGGAPIGGNYWSGYAGADSNSDGFGDTNYATAGSGGNDYFPLVSAVDGVAPVFTESPADSNYYMNENVLLKFEAIDYGFGLSGFDVNDSENFDINSDGYLTNNTELNAGYYPITVTALDLANNQSSSSIIINVLDENGPMITLISPDDFFQTQSTTVSFIYTSSDSSDTNHCLFYIDGELIASDSNIENFEENYFEGTGIEIGDHNWEISCTDLIGNDSVSGTRYFSVLPPSVASGGSQADFVLDLSGKNYLNFSAKISANKKIELKPKQKIPEIIKITLDTNKLFIGRIKITKNSVAPDGCKIPQNAEIFSIVTIEASNESAFNKVSLDINVPKTILPSLTGRKISGIKCLPFYSALETEETNINGVYRFSSTGFSTWVILAFEKQTDENNSISHVTTKETEIEPDFPEDIIDKNESNILPIEENSLPPVSSSNNKESLDLGIIFLSIVIFCFIWYIRRHTKI